MRRVGFVIMMLALASLACVGSEFEQAGQESQQPAQPATAVAFPTAVTPGFGDGAVSGSDAPAAFQPVQISPEIIDRVTAASVQIVARQAIGAQAMWTGSGTVVSAAGLILTNCHVACGAPVLEIRMTADPAQPPETRFYAQVTSADEDLDLAVLQIVADASGNSVTPSGLTFLEIGDSNLLRLGDPVLVFGYPGVGGDTITFTSGSVSGFESAQVSGNNERVVIKTDAEIASGNSGGTAVDLQGRLIGVPTAVNPDVREGVTLGQLGVLRPINLVGYVVSGSAPPPQAGAGGAAPVEDPDRFEPNDTADQAVGPLGAGDSLQGYLSWDGDLDIFYINTRSTQQITVALEGPAGADFDLYLFDANNQVAESIGQTASERIEFRPATAGLYFIVVHPYAGATPNSPYTLRVDYDGGTSVGLLTTGTAQISGALADVFGNPLSGGLFGLLRPGVSCAQFFANPQADLSLVLDYAEADSSGFFNLPEIPRATVYSAFVVYGDDYVCEDNWLELDDDTSGIDLGLLNVEF